MDDVFFSIINVPCLAAGFLGGIVHVYSVKKASAREVIGYLITGAIGANFIAPQLLKLLTVFPLGFIAFGVGMSGKHLCQAVEMFFNKLDVLGKTKNE